MPIAPAITKVVGELKNGSPQVATVTDPFTTGGVSKDATIAAIRVGYTTTATELTSATTDALQHAADDGRGAGLTVEIGGDALTPVPKVGSAEVLGLLVTVIVLLLTFGSGWRSVSTTRCSSSPATARNCDPVWIASRPWAAPRDRRAPPSSSPGRRS